MILDYSRLAIVSPVNADEIFQAFTNVRNSIELPQHIIIHPSMLRPLAVAQRADEIEAEERLRRAFEAGFVSRSKRQLYPRSLQKRVSMAFRRFCYELANEEIPDDDKARKYLFAESAKLPL